MKLNVREAAAVLNVPETRIYRWIDDEEIPFIMIHHHPMFHRLELLEWAMAMELPVRVDLYEDEHDQPFTRALERGGARTLPAQIADLAADLPIETAERDVIRAILVARETTAFLARRDEKLALPRARSPLMICPQQPARMMLWWGERALAIGDIPVHALFAIIAPTIKEHLQLLSRLSLALHDAAFVAAVQARSAFDRVIAEARRWELAVEGGAA